jgi:hypothetical protein
MRAGSAARSSLFCVVIACAFTSAAADEPRFLEFDNGERLGYVVHIHPADAHLPEASAILKPRNALSTAKLVTQYLAEGKIEDASLLSNAPKARYERLRESFEGWSDSDFRRAFGRYFDVENRIVAEVQIHGHRLLIWHLKDTDHLAAFFLVQVEDRMLLDDVPNETRANLRKVLQAYRDGKAK